MAQRNDFIYCDPPYSHSQSILYGAQSFQLEELFNEIDKAKARGVKVALSIDGKKKSGQYVCDLPIPPNLFQMSIKGVKISEPIPLDGATVARIAPLPKNGS